jgi:hypothetical protein
MWVEPAAGHSRGNGASLILRYRSALALAGIVIASFVLLDRQRAPVTFFYDEWAFVQFRRGWGVDGFFEPHVGHLVAVPALLYRIGFELFGLTHYRPFRWLGLVAHFTVVAAAWVYVRRRCGELAALAVGAAVALLGAGWQNIYFPFSISHTLALSTAIGAWLLIERCSGRADRVASALHVVSIGCSGIGLPPLAGTALALAIRREWRRLGVVVGPAAVSWLAWMAIVRPSGRTRLSNLPLAPRYMVDMWAGGAAALFGRDLLWGRVLLGVLAGMAAANWRRLHLAAAPLAAMVVNAVLAAVARADIGDPAASRYAYTTAVLILLTAAAMAQPSWRSAPALPAQGLLAVLVLASVWGNLAVLQRGALGLRIDSGIAAAELRAVEWAATRVDPSYEPDPHRMPTVTAGHYLAAVADLGSPAVGLPATEHLDPLTRELVDRVSASALRPDVAAVGDTFACSAQAVLVIERNLAGGEPIVAVAFGAPVEIRLRRYGDEFPTQPDIVIAAGQAQRVTVPADGAPRQQWQVEMRSADAFASC